MINIGGFSIPAFVVAVRWARLRGYPELLDDWTEEQSEQLEKVAKEYDRRQDKKYGNQEC